MKLQPLLTDTPWRNTAHSVNFLIVSHKAIAQASIALLPCCLRPFVHCISRWQQWLISMPTISNKSAIWQRGARNQNPRCKRHINKVVKPNCLSFPITCSVQLRVMGLQNSFCIDTTKKALNKFVNCRSELWLSTHGRAIQEAGTIQLTLG